MQRCCRVCYGAVGFDASGRTVQERGGSVLNRVFCAHGDLCGALALGLTVGLALMLAGGCSPKKTAAPERATKEKPYDFEREGRIPEAQGKEKQAEPDIQEMPIEPEEVAAEDVEAPPDTARAVPPDSAGAGAPAIAPPAGVAGVAGQQGGTAVPVFRVQVFATANETAAQDTKRNAEARLGLAAYVALEEGLFKVRVGDATTRVEAEKIRRRCQNAGYTDAWIVTDVRKTAP